jgi:hypothetical protein
MNLKEYVSITGHSGLFKVISQAKSGVIIESLVDGKRSLNFARQKMVTMDNVSFYCVDGDKPFREILALIYAKTEGKEAFDVKSTPPEQLYSYILELVPTLDKGRVYNSHIAKIFIWYNQLLKAGALESINDVDKVEIESDASDSKLNEKAPTKKATTAKGNSTEKIAKPTKAAPKVAKSIGVRKTG